MGCQSRWRASWTFFSICPFSQPEAGLQNSASNRKWLTMAEKRALTWRSLPRPTLSTAVRILWDGRLPLSCQHCLAQRREACRLNYSPSISVSARFTVTE